MGEIVILVDKWFFDGYVYFWYDNLFVNVLFILIYFVYLLYMQFFI